jgi:hypothetical protein
MRNIRSKNTNANQLIPWPEKSKSRHVRDRVRLRSAAFHAPNAPRGLPSAAERSIFLPQLESPVLFTSEFHLSGVLGFGVFFLCGPAFCTPCQMT